MMVRLSARLQAVADQVQSHGVAADIGCDHGFVSIYLVQQGMVERAIAMDVNPGPLERAREHVRQYGLADRIALRRSDGAAQLTPGEADTILISGMGGALICRILQEGKEAVCAARELVLSPQSEIHLVRRRLHGLGFRIAAETMTADQGKYYVVIRAVAGTEQYGEETEYLYGKKLIEGRTPVFREFLKKEAGRIEAVLDGMEKKPLSGPGRLKREALLQKQEQIRRVLHRMDREHTGAEDTREWSAYGRTDTDHGRRGDPVL